MPHLNRLNSAKVVSAKPMHHWGSKDEPPHPQQQQQKQ